MTTKTEVIYGSVPSKSNSYAPIGNRLVKTKVVRDYEKTFSMQCQIHRGLAIGTPFRLTLDVFSKNRRSDLDGSLKIILDCLKQCLAIVDDRFCYEINCRKFIDRENPRIEFQLKRLEQHTTEQTDLQRDC